MNLNVPFKSSDLANCIELPWSAVQSEVQLRWYQLEAIAAIFKYFQVSGGNPVIALPTGTGKSVVIAAFIKMVFHMYPSQRIMMLTHVKELVKQNSERLKVLWPNAPVGIYSDGLNEKSINMPITFGGVASVVNVVDMFGHIDLLIVDECHLINDSEDSMYGSIIAKLAAKNPFLKVIGLSATPYRMKRGLLTEGNIFSHIAYDLTDMEGFNRLLAEGHLAHLIPMPTQTELDISSVGVSGGELIASQLQRAVDKDELTYACVEEMVRVAASRNSWLVFGSGVKHVEHITEALQSFGIEAASVHSKMASAERDRRIDLFKRGWIQCIVNNGVLTTGFDHPPLDYIGVMRATLSPGLWVQMLGRGTRPYDWWNQRQYVPGFNYTKTNCLVSDFAGNTKRLGPINDPIIPKAPKKGMVGDAPVKICENCGMYNHSSARFCGGEPFVTNAGCGFEFKFQPKIFAGASDLPLINPGNGPAQPAEEVAQPEIKWLDVNNVFYERHRSKARDIDTLKVTYVCGVKTIVDYVLLEHGGINRRNAMDWWFKFSTVMPPETVAEAVTMTNTLRQPPFRIEVKLDQKYPKVLRYEF